MFRFTIRELVLLTLVVAVSVSWWIDRSRILANAENNRQFVEGFRKSGIDPDEFLQQLTSGWPGTRLPKTQPLP